MWQAAFTNARTQWEALAWQLGWHQCLLALAYLSCAWLCFVGGHAARGNNEGASGWFLAAGLLVAIGVNTLLRLDFLLLSFLREVAQLQGWYGQRREIQYLLLALMAVGGLMALGWLRTRLRATWTTGGLVAMGMCVLLLLAVLRAVSFHYTDAWLDLRLAGVSLGRMGEMAGLGMVLTGAWRWLQVR
jgi:hypothetical protein